MNLSEIFKANGVSDETATAVFAGMKENKIFTAGEENLDLRYGKLKDEHASKLSELEQANGLIAELKKSTKGNEDLQGRITDYEAQVQQLQNQLEQTKIEAAIKVALLSAKATDVDYLTFKLREKGEITLDENGNIAGIADKLAGLKTNFPQHFESSSSKRIDEHKLEHGEDDSTLSKSDILKKPYAERAKLFAENPEAYREAMKG